MFHGSLSANGSHSCNEADSDACGMMNFKRLMTIGRLGAFLIFMLNLAANNTPAQPYPYRPIRIVDSEAGGGGDFIARQLAQAIAGPMGQPVIVDNRGGGFIPAEFTAKAT